MGHHQLIHVAFILRVEVEVDLEVDVELKPQLKQLMLTNEEELQFIFLAQLRTSRCNGGSEKKKFWRQMKFMAKIELAQLVTVYF